MTSPTSGGAWTVHASSALLREIERLQEQAARQGRGRETLAAIREIHERLRLNPLNFGEPLYRLPALRLHVRHGIILPLAVDFAVCEDQPRVFIKAMRLL